MFMTTGDLQRPHMIQTVVSATTHLTFKSEKIDQFEAFDQLIDQCKQKLLEKARAHGGDGLIYVQFDTNIAQMNVAPRFLVVTGYGTVCKLKD